MDKLNDLCFLRITVFEIEDTSDNDGKSKYMICVVNAKVQSTSKTKST